MSQAKVDRRKEYKKDRKKILAREKRRNKIAKAAAYLCLICVIGGVGFSFYKKFNPEPKADAGTFYGLTAVDSYGILDPSLPEQTGNN